jgi:hypothetical protein
MATLAASKCGASPNCPSKSSARTPNPVAAQPGRDQQRRGIMQGDGRGIYRAQCPRKHRRLDRASQPAQGMPVQEGVHEPAHPSINLGRRTAKPTATEGDGDRCRCGRGVRGRVGTCRRASAMDSRLVTRMPSFSFARLARARPKRRQRCTARSRCRTSSSSTAAHRRSVPRRNRSPPSRPPSRRVAARRTGATTNDV